LTIASGNGFPRLDRYLLIGNHPAMCNLYSMTKGPQASLISRALRNEVGNLEPQFEFYPDQMASENLPA